ncbi:hypothetical protein Tco_0324557 [Tanacetum coccineum]
MDQDSAHRVDASKVPMLKLGEYEIWRVRIEQYIKMTDYALWEVIKNGVTLPKTKIMERVMTEMPITTTEEWLKEIMVKLKLLLLIGIPNEHQLKFNSIKDAKKLLEAVEKRFVMVNTISFISSMLILLGIKRLVSAARIETTNEAVNTAHGVSTASTQVNAANSTNIDNLSDAVIVYQVFEDMLKTFDRDDLVKLWSLVQERFNSTEPTEDKEIEIWVELKRLFEPDADDELWKSQKHIHDITWRLYDTCGVHHVSTKDGMDIYMLVEREYPLSRGVLTQMLVAKLLVEQNNEMSRELLRKIFMQIERPRR